MSGGTDFLSLGDQDAAAFRSALRHLAGAVSIITGGQGEGRSGLTATSVSSLSAEPPAVIVSVNRNASAWPVLTGERRFSINTLASDQQAVADRFAGRGGRPLINRRCSIGAAAICRSNLLPRPSARRTCNGFVPVA